MPKVSFRLVNDKDGFLAKTYPFWIGTLLGLIFVFLAFFVAVADINNQKRIHSAFMDFPSNIMLRTPLQMMRKSSQSGVQISVLSPAPGEVITGSKELSATVQNTNHQISAVKFLIDGSEVAVFVSGPYTFTWDSANVKNGSHMVSVMVVDETGFSTLNQVSVTVAN